jgi:hypothetical protein
VTLVFSHLEVVLTGGKERLCRLHKLAVPHCYSLLKVTLNYISSAYTLIPTSLSPKTTIKTSFSTPEHIMSDYTSTRDGFQRAMQWSLTGPPEEAKAYAEATVLPTFYHTMNGHKLDYDTYVKGIEEWRAKISEYKPNVLVEPLRLEVRSCGVEFEADTPYSAPSFYATVTN